MCISVLHMAWYIRPSPAQSYFKFHPKGLELFENGFLIFSSTVPIYNQKMQDF